MCYIFREVIFLRTNFGFLIRILHWCTHQAMDNALESMELTAAQGQIMAYLAHAKQPPCPRDVEAEFHLTHPTVSGILSRLEQALSVPQLLQAFSLHCLVNPFSVVCCV